MKILCKKCGLVDNPKTTIIPLPQGGGHIKANCAGCGSFIKFLPHSKSTLYFGKYKGKTIAEIASIDRDYLRWCIDNGVIKSNKLKAAIEGVVNG